MALDVDGDFAEALRRVAVEENAGVARDPPNRGDIVQRSDLIVRVHDRDQHRARRDGTAHRVGVDRSVAVDRQHRDRRAARLLQRLAGVEHRLVLGGGGDDVLAALRMKLDRALDRQVVRLGRAAGENDVARLGVDQGGDLRPRLLDRLFGLPAPRVAAARRVAEALAEVRQHGFEHARIDRRGGVVVEVDAAGHA